MKNKMRNVQFAQNYSASAFRIALSNRDNNLDLCYRDLNQKQDWLDKFNEIIEDLQKGYWIDGKGEKNTIFYWQRQINMLNEFENK